MWRLEVSNGLPQTSRARAQEARLHKWASPAQPIYNCAADSRVRPGLCGPWASLARSVYFLLLKFIHFFLCGLIQHLVF